MRIYESVQIIEARFRYTKDVQVVYEEWINDLFLKSFDGELKFQSGLLRKNQKYINRPCRYSFNGLCCLLTV